MFLPDKESLREHFDQYTDDQLMDVLRNYKNYREEAVDVAVEIALQRKLIRNRDVLLSSDYNRTSVPSKRIFPALTTREQEDKMRVSLLRIVWLIAAVPLIFAGINFFGDHFSQAAIWGACALAWAAVTWRIERTGEPRLIFLLVALFLGVHIIYLPVARYTFDPGIMDLVIYTASVLVFFYLLGYLYVILCRKAKGS